MPDKIQAARLKLVKERPYLASAIYSLIPVRKEGLKTMAVDMWWRLYFDPAVTDKWSVDEILGVLYHEICHLLRDHPQRMKNFDPSIANIATDAEINDDLVDESIKLPSNPILPEQMGLPKNLLAEEYIEILLKQKQASAQGVSAKINTNTFESGNAQADNTHSGNGSDDSDSKDRDVSDSKSSDDGDTLSSSSLDQSDVSLSQSGSSFQPPTGPIDTGCTGRSIGTFPEEQGPTPAVGAGRCGSCATGQAEQWEEKVSDKDVPSISKAEAELIRREVARQIKEHIRSMSEIPDHLKRWAEEKLQPRVNWKRELSLAIRHAFTDISGTVDYSYNKPSRRQGHIKNIIFPSLRQFIPNVAVVVDTSGSISDSMLSQSLAEVSGILKSLGQRDCIHVLSCDAQVHTCQKVFRSNQVKLLGSGGTDMEEGLDAVAKIRPTPQVCIVITDGYTPWPSQPPKGIKKVIVVLLDKSESVPSWARVVRIEPELREK